jgi:hypothetical protein
MEQSLRWDTFLFITPLILGLILGLLLGAGSTLAQTLHFKTHIPLQILSPKNPALERLRHAFGLGLGLDSRVLCPVLLSSLGLCGLFSDALMAPLLLEPWLYVPAALLISLFLTAQIGQGMGHCFENMLELHSRIKE